MLYVIMLIVAVSYYCYMTKEIRQNKKEKERQNALWQLASIKEHIENSQFSR